MDVHGPMVKRQLIHSNEVWVPVPRGSWSQDHGPAQLVLFSVSGRQFIGRARSCPPLLRSLLARPPLPPGAEQTYHSEHPGLAEIYPGKFQKWR